LCAGLFFHLFFRSVFEIPSIINDFAHYLEKKMLAINKERVDFKGNFFYKGVSSLRERK